MAAPTPKPIIWMGDSLDRLREFSAEVQDEMGYGLYVAQIGKKPIVLHAFQKKSRKGIATPQREIELIAARLKLAEELHRKREKH